MSNPVQVAFDGQFILVANFGNSSVSLWRAADFTPVGSYATGAGIFTVGVCNDAVNFWITLDGTNQLRDSKGIVL